MNGKNAIDHPLPKDPAENSKWDKRTHMTKIMPPLSVQNGEIFHSRILQSAGLRR